MTDHHYCTIVSPSGEYLEVFGTPTVQNTFGGSTTKIGAPLIAEDGRRVTPTFGDFIVEGSAERWKKVE